MEILGNSTRHSAKRQKELKELRFKLYWLQLPWERLEVIQKTPEKGCFVPPPPKEFDLNGDQDFWNNHLWIDKTRAEVFGYNAFQTVL